MSLPRVAIVGRPNVGKSSLLNMLAKRKVSIVDDMPGVTRDRVTTVVEVDGPLQTEKPKRIELIDTGGYGVYVTAGNRFDDAGEDLATLTDDIEGQIAAAVDRADLILFVVDSQAGVTPVDEAIATMLRQRALGGKGRREIPVVVVANKVDADNWEPHGYEGAALGFGEPWLVSAKTNFRRRTFREQLFERVPYEVVREGEDESRPVMNVALVGRRNAGKSTFVNALAGEERVIVSEIAGTTRDAIDVRFEMNGRAMLAIDTAGVRKRNKFADRVEYWAFDRCQGAVERADVVLLLLDATQRISGVDKRLGRMVATSFKPVVIVVTKWDLAEGRKTPQGVKVTLEHYKDYFNKQMPGLRFAPIVFTSALDRGRGVREAVEVAFELFEQARTRVSTGQLNQFFRDLLARRGPSSSLGTRAKVFFATQVKECPPTIVLVVNKPKLFDERYMRYLMNRIREELPFEEIPVRVLVRERKRADIDDLLSGKHRREQAALRSVLDGEAKLDAMDGEVDEDAGLEDLAGAVDLPTFFDDEDAELAGDGGVEVHGQGGDGADDVSHPLMGVDDEGGEIVGGASPRSKPSRRGKKAREAALASKGKKAKGPKGGKGGGGSAGKGKRGKK